MRFAGAAVLVCVACGGATKATVSPPAPSTELSPALAPLAWWLGDWKSKDGSEHWTAAAGAIYGVGLHVSGSFEVLIVDDAEGGGPADGVLRLFTMPGGTSSTELTQTAHTRDSATFANPTHDDPTSITYARQGSGLTAELRGPSAPLTFTFGPAPHSAAPELETADLAFSADAKARGAEGWASWFAPDGWMWRRGAKVEGPAIRESMEKLLSTGVLSWAPVASGKLGTLGYTVGKATYTGTAADDHWRSSYVTIWKQQPDGAWKVLFDTGRGVNEP
ncbi:hypothetical protein BH11MYX3_BH11MYX3_06270 [soil metagenome]